MAALASVAVLLIGLELVDRSLAVVVAGVAGTAAAVAWIIRRRRSG